MDMASALDAAAVGRVGKPVIRFDGKSITYEQFQGLTLKAANLLRSQGIGHGDHVGLMCFNTPGFLIAAFGAWRLGAVVIPINHKLQAPEVDYVLQHARVKMLVFDGSLASVVDRCKHSCVRMATAISADEYFSFDKAVENMSAEIRLDRVSSDAVAEILYTSGTTGKPKGCVHTHRNLLSTALTVIAMTSITERERMLISMPIWHSSPLNNWTIGTIVIGGTLVLLREYSPKAFLEIIEAERTTTTFCAPVALLAPLTAVADFDRYDLSSMTRWIYGGGPIGADMATKLIEKYGSDQFLQVYGMTEAGPLGTALYAHDAVRKAGSIGCNAGPGLEIKVLRPDGTRVAAGEVGEIHLRSHAMMNGYLDDEKATKDAFTADGWYRSGDLAQVDEEGYMFIVDRAKDMIVTGGENVFLKEGEEALSPHPAIADVAVIGVPHPHWGETVTATIVLKTGASTDADELKTYLGPLLAKYKIPRIYKFMDNLPRTPSGKLKKHEIRADLAASEGTAPSR